MTRQSSNNTVLLCTAASDSHTWNLVYLDLLLAENGFSVTNLGPCTPDDLLVSTACAQRPAAIVMSTVNGHGHLDGARVARRLRELDEIRDVCIVIGGKLGISGSVTCERKRTLWAAGFDVVFPEEARPEQLVSTLNEMLVRQLAEQVAR